jgi:hypothetical protein
MIVRRQEPRHEDLAGWNVLVLSATGTFVLLGLCLYLGDYEPLKEWIGIVLVIMLPWLAIAGATYLILRLFGIRPTFRNKK